MLLTDQVIQIATIVIAIAAVTVAVWEGVMTRRHNRLALMPHLLIRGHFSGSQGRVGLALYNDGSGPAYIDACTVSVDGEVMPDNGDDGWDSAISALDLDDIRPSLAYNSITPDGFIRVGGVLWLLSAPVSKCTDDCLDLFHTNVQVNHDLHISIPYRSVYGDKRCVISGTK